MGDPSIIVYGADWCEDCRRARLFLDRYDIPYLWIDIEDNQIAEQFVIKSNNSLRRILTIIFQDGSSSQIHKRVYKKYTTPIFRSNHNRPGELSDVGCT